MSDGSYNPQLDITNYVSKYREMDPETEDLIADGCELKNGMRVLVASPAARVDVSHGFNDPLLMDGVNKMKLDEAKEKNRWCTISQLSYDGDLVSFVATYDDGTKRKRTYNCDKAWLVKLDSIPQEHPTCDHAIDMHYPHCSTPGCPNYAGLFVR